MIRARPAPCARARAGGRRLARAPRAVLVAACVGALIAACRARPAAVEVDAGPTSPHVAAPSPAAAPAPPTAAPSALAIPPRSTPPSDPVVRALEVAPIVGLTLRGRPGRAPLEARLALDPGLPALRIELSLADLAAPLAATRPLAFHALARALGLAVAAPAALRRFGIAEIGRALGGSPDTSELLRRLVVQNDGTVDGLLVAWPEAARVVSAESSIEAVRALRIAAAEVADPGEDVRLARAFVELLVVDYLSGNGVRRGVLLDEVRGALAAVDNAGAFPPWTDPAVTVRQLGRLRALRRFPRGLREALARFDRPAALAAFSPGELDTWLLSPRTLVELDERRTALLTLLDARVAALGADRVLSL